MQRVPIERGRRRRGLLVGRRSALIWPVVWLLASTLCEAQGFDSGSDGSDGALDLTGQTGTLNFNPGEFQPPLDPDGDGVYHFTTITIPQDLTVRLSADILGVAPVTWLASGTVTVAGVLDLAGRPGHDADASAIPSVAGAGGYGGGTGGKASRGPQVGNGPGGGKAPASGGGHATEGGAVGGGGAPGRAYGNDFLLPLLGGSGGAGGELRGQPGGGGGAGGGAILIASSMSISIDGSVVADGGSGACRGTSAPDVLTRGGGGSGGAIRLIAPVISGTGELSARQGGSCGTVPKGANGRIRIETFQNNFTGVVGPVPFTATPGLVFPPDSGPSVRVVRVGGLDVPASPTGSFVNPDVTLEDASTVTLEIEARRIPLGTVVQLTIFPETGESQTVDSTPLAGTFEASTATAEMSVPHGFSRFFVEASWTP